MEIWYDIEEGIGCPMGLRKEPFYDPIREPRELALLNCSTEHSANAQPQPSEPAQ